MKLRIQDNSIRLRLTQKEVARLRTDGAVEAAVEFGGGRRLRYAVVVSDAIAELAANYEGDSIEVLLPAITAAGWAESDQVTLEGRDAGVHILVEKDFQCLHRSAEQDPDAYANPLAGSAH